MSIKGISNPPHIAASSVEHVARDGWNLALNGAKDAASGVEHVAEDDRNLALNGPTPGIILQNIELYNASGPNANEPSLSDIRQGSYGDCSFLASLGALVQNDPNAVKNMIHDNGNGTYTVALHVQNNDFHDLWGVCGKSYTTKRVTSSANEISPSGVHGGCDNGKQVIWPAVVEAAYAKLHDTKIFGHDLGINSGYGNIGGGSWPQPVLETLTGRDAQSYSPLVFLIVKGAGLKSQFDNGKLIVMSTPESDGAQDGYDKGLNPYGLIGGHAYTVINVYMKNGQEYVSLNNPWGFDQPQDIPLSELPKVSDVITVGTA